MIEPVPASNSRGAAAAWTVASRVTAQLGQLAVFVIAARCLSPAEFGVYSLVSAANMLVARFASAGFSEFAASWQGDRDTDAHAFSLALVSSCALSITACAVGAILPQLGASADQVWLHELLSVSVLVSGPIAVWTGLLLRWQRGADLAKALLVAEGIGTAATCGALMLGGGMFALGGGKLLGALIQAGAMALYTGHFPRLRFASAGRAQILIYARSMVTSGVLAYLRGYGATLLIGLFLGAAPVGLFRAATRLVASAAEVVAEPVRVVCWSALRLAAARADIGDAQVREQALAETARKLLTLVLLVAVPLFAGLAITAETLITSVLGDTWSGAASSASVLALARLLMLPTVLTTPLLSMANRVAEVPRIELWSGLATLIVLPCTAPFGLLPTAGGQLVAAAFGLWLAVRAWTRTAPVDAREAFLRAAPGLFASAAMVITVLLLGPQLTSSMSSRALHLPTQLSIALFAFVPVFSLLGGWRSLARAYR